MLRWVFVILPTWAMLVAQENSLPKMYKSLWPNFCYKHLCEDPITCSEGMLDHLDCERFGYDDIVESVSIGNMFDNKDMEEWKSFFKKIPCFENDKCAYVFCEMCRTPLKKIPVCRQPKYEDNSNAALMHMCNCNIYIRNTKSMTYDRVEFVTYNDRTYETVFLTPCKELAFPSLFFKSSTKTYLPFLKQHLSYCEENPLCSCYWPYLSKIACNISDSIFDQMQLLLKEPCYSMLIPMHDNFRDVISDSNWHFFEEEILLHAVQNRFLQTFFYSQYHQVILGLCKTIDACSLEESQHLDVLYGLLDAIQPQFLELYTECLKKHPHPKIHYERGMVYQHYGMAEEAIQDIRCLIEKGNFQFLALSDLYFQEGKAYAELGLYDKAIEELTKAIQRDPDNKEAYLERAAAHFELDNLDQALEDYVSSGIQPTSPEILPFSLGIARGVIRGTMQGGYEFIPSILASINGIGHGLWAFACDPVEVSSDFITSAKACIEFIKTHTPQESLTELVPELKELIEKWADLEDRKKGEIFGFIVGKYGVEIFAGTTFIKGMQIYRNLKRANHLLTLEAMAISERNKDFIKICAAGQKATRKEVLKNANLKIQWDKQGKHIDGHRNFDPKKSTFTHQNPESLIERFAGTGTKAINEIPGTPGYQEIVNFEEIIGYVASNGDKIATTWGKIHYAKDGVHIVPRVPKG